MLIHKAENIITNDGDARVFVHLTKSQILNTLAALFLRENALGFRRENALGFRFGR